MSGAKEKAEHFLNHERAFRLGALLTESSHPKTATLSQTTERSVPDGIRMLVSVDEEIAPAARKVLAGEAPTVPIPDIELPFDRGAGRITCHRLLPPCAAGRPAKPPRTR